MGKWKTWRLIPGYFFAYVLLPVVLPLAASEHRGRVMFGALPVPGATVTAERPEKALSTVTDSQGKYAFADLADGAWVFRVEMLCFEIAKQEITVAKDSPPAVWDLRIQPLNKILEKAESAPTAAAPAADPSGKEARKDMSSRPGAAASFQRLDVNAAGTAPIQAEREAKSFAGQTPEDLAQRASDGFLINGSVNNSSSSNFGLLPAFGNVRKGPSSLYNGNIGFMLDNSALNARPYSFTGQSAARPDYNRMTGVLSFGGPIRVPWSKRSGPNLMLNYQWTRNRNASTLPGRMPGIAEREGDFSRSIDSLGRPLQIFDPVTGNPFPGNVIPQNRISQQAKSLLALFPLPNFSGGAQYNYQIPVSDSLHQDNLQLWLSKAVRKNQFSGNFDWQNARTDNPNIFGFAQTTRSTGMNAGMNWRHTFSMRTASSVALQVSRLVQRTSPFFRNRSNVSGLAGISGNEQSPDNWGPPDLIFASGITTLSDARASFNRTQTTGTTMGLYWNRGRHGLSFGGEWRRQQLNPVGQQNARGTFTFTGASTQAVSGGARVSATGSDFAGFLLGIPDASSIAFGNGEKYFRFSTYSAFMTDDWRVNSGLTLNAGLRWEYGTPITELRGRLVNLDITPGFAAAATVTGTSPGGPLTGTKYRASLLRPDRFALQPRVGISWRPVSNSSMVVRAGYGLYYNTSIYSGIAAQMSQQPPFSKNLSLQNSRETPLTLADGFTGLPGALPTYAVNPDLRVGRLHSWQLSIQRDLPFALVMIASYLGSKGSRGQQQFLPNTYPIGAENRCPPCPAGFAYMTSGGSSSRQAGHLQLRRRLRSGLSAALQYTFSKSLDNAALGGRGQGVAVTAQNWQDLAAEKALSGFDQRHLADLQVQYTSGMGIKGGALANGWAGRLLREWTFTGQVTAGSGLPLTPVYLTPVKGTGMTGSIRPDRTAAPIDDGPAGLHLNPAAYAPPETGKWGNAGRNSITGPAQFVFNASVGRTFRSKDRVSIDLRVDSSNAINHVTFPNWNTVAGSSQFGLPAAANPMRTLQTTMRARF